MPKGRGADERRRSHRQRNPKDRSTIQQRGALKLEALYRKRPSYRALLKRQRKE